MFYLGLLYYGNFILSNDFKEKLDETQFYATMYDFGTSNQKMQSDPNFHTAHQKEFQKILSSPDQLLCLDFVP